MNATKVTFDSVTRPTARLLTGKGATKQSILTACFKLNVRPVIVMEFTDSYCVVMGCQNNALGAEIRLPIAYKNNVQMVEDLVGGPATHVTCDGQQVVIYYHYAKEGAK